MAVSFVCLIVMMSGFTYSDGDPYISWSCELLDCIFRKTDMDFYSYTTFNLRSMDESLICCDKTIPMMLPVALWNLPVWIAHEITGNMIVTGFWDMMWMKLGFLVCIVAIAAECSKIVRIVRPDADHLIAYPLVFASFDLMVSTMYATQDEVVYLLALVLAMRFLLEDKIKAFLLCSAITVALNPEMLIPVLIMILFHEKRIGHIILYSAVSLIPTMAFNILYRTNETYHRYTLMDNSLVGSLFGGDIALSQLYGDVSLFLVVTCVLAFYAFALKKDTAKKHDLVWIMAVFMTSMTLLSSGGILNFFYRSLLYVPFLVVLILVSVQDLRINMILYLLYTWFRGWMCVILNYPRNMSTEFLNLDNEFTTRIFNKAGTLTLGKYYSDKFQILGNFGLITAVCLAAAALIFYINHSKNQDKPITTVKIPQDVLVFISGLFAPLMLLAFCFMMINSDTYVRQLVYGSDYIEYNEQVLGHACYLKNNGIDMYNTQIVYEDTICLLNGEDRDGKRYIYQDGGSFGPYITLYPGTYQVTVTGEGLQNAVYDCTYNLEGMPYQIPVNVLDVSDGYIVYEFSIEEITYSIEMRFFNQTSEPVVIDHIDIREMD